MDECPPQRAIYGAVDVVGHEHRACRNQSSAESFGQDHHVRFYSEMMRGEKWSGAIETGLDLVEHEQSAVFPAKQLDFAEVPRPGHTDSCLGLDRFHNES